LVTISGGQIMSMEFSNDLEIEGVKTKQL